MRCALGAASGDGRRHARASVAGLGCGKQRAAALAAVFDLGAKAWARVERRDARMLGYTVQLRWQRASPTVVQATRTRRAVREAEQE